jgi:hypothetical protein
MITTICLLVIRVTNQTVPPLSDIQSTMITLFLGCLLVAKADTNGCVYISGKENII